MNTTKVVRISTSKVSRPDDPITTAFTIHNHFDRSTIPYSFLTRKEKEPLLPIESLTTYPPLSPVYKFTNTEQEVLFDYQSLCLHHLKAMVMSDTHPYIYVNMHHLSLLSSSYPLFYRSGMDHQFHFILQVIGFNQLDMTVQPLYIDDIQTFINHQYLAREQEKLYNLKYQVSSYYHCLDCLPTLCGIGLRYEENGCIPSKLDIRDNPLRNTAYKLIKNDRLNFKVLCKVAQEKWKVDNLIEYEEKIKNVGESRNWDYHQIVLFIHKTHYNCLKQGERVRDKPTYHQNWSPKRNLDSPSWKSSVRVC